jgi:4-amino-4-deoxy-L-arabinose transferase-like glycosyltransferase
MENRLLACLSFVRFAVRPVVGNPYAVCLLLVVFCALLFGFRLADRDLWASHEARAAQDAQMILNGDSWALPRLFDQQVELQKPPLYYWLVAAAAWLRGQPVDAWAVRGPAFLAAMGGVLALYVFGFARRRPLAGLVAALVLATAVHYTWLARTARIDMPLTLAVSMALGGFYLGQRLRREWGGRRAWWCFLITYGSVAVALLLKGPIGAVLPTAVAGVWLLLEGDLPLPWHGRRWLRLIHDLGLWWGIPVVLMLAGPWYVWAGVQTHGSLFRTFFWQHNIERAFGGGRLRAHAWYLYGPYLTTNFLPWSLLLPVAGWYAWRQRREQGDPEARFGLVWLAVMLLVLSLLRFKRADYLLPALPGAALFLGYTAERWYRTSVYPRRLAAAFGLVLLGCLAGWWVYVDRVLPAHEGPARAYQRFAAEVRRQVPAPGLVLFFRAEAHLLAYHIGPPLNTFLEWENLNVWAGRPGHHYIIMPADCAAEWPQHVTSGSLEEVLRSTDLDGNAHRLRPVVLMRTHPGVPPSTFVVKSAGDS